MRPISRPGARLCGEAAHDVISEEAINGMRGPWQPVSALGNDGGRARLRALFTVPARTATVTTAAANSRADLYASTYTCSERRCPVTIAICTPQLGLTTVGPLALR